MTGALHRATTAAGEASVATLSLPSLLANTAAELGRIAAMVGNVEAAIFDAVESAADNPVAVVDELHYLDFILQHLTELAGVLDRLALVTPQVPVVDDETILGPIRLAVLRQGLSRPPLASSVHDGPAVEKIELF